MRNTVFIIVCVCLSVLSVSAQDLSGQIKSYLGSLSGKTAPQATLTFYFQDEKGGQDFQIEMNGDGKKSWMDVVASYEFDNNKPGRLQAVYAGDDKVVPSAAFVSSPRTSASVASQSDAPPASRPSSLWDWWLPLDKIEGYKKDLDNGIVEFGQQLRPRQDFLGYVGWKVALPILSVLFWFFWWLCKLSFHEIGKSHGRNTWQYRGMSVVGYGSRWMCFVLISATVLTYVMNDMVYRYFSGGNMLIWMALNGGFIWLSLELAKWAVPDPPGSHKVPAGGGGNRNGGGRGGYEVTPVD